MIPTQLKKYIPDQIEATLSQNTICFPVSKTDLVTVIQALAYEHKLSFKLMTATDERKDAGDFKIWYIFSVPDSDFFIIPFVRVTQPETFPSLALTLHQTWDYERKIQTFFGLTPIGHPDARPIILHENWPVDVWPLRKDFNWDSKQKSATTTYSYQNIEGEGIYEIPVGPIHAGIIEPGHFRFSVAGENIINLEPRLGFTHKGSEKLFETVSLSEKLLLSEKVSGDSSCSHSLAFALAVEKLADIDVPARASHLRLIYAELERVANHFGDLGAIMQDAGFNFGGSQCSRLREMIMRINDRLTASRFLRGVITFGGVNYDLETETTKKLTTDLHAITADFSEVMEIATGSMSLLNRLRDTGTLEKSVAIDAGVVGVAGRALGLPADVRLDHPYCAYDTIVPDCLNLDEPTGDVYARFNVRIAEVYSSIKLILLAIEKLPGGAIKNVTPVSDFHFRKNSQVVTMVEGWRGEIVYFVTTDKDGSISRVVPRDPSVINWSILKDAGFDNVIPDFPLINKSFNLSYSGNDM